MKKRQGKLKTLYLIALALLSCVLASVLIPSLSANAKTVYDEENNKYTIDTSYYFKKAGLKIDVRRDKTFAVEETLETVFLHENTNTGIIRDIQRISTTTRIADGKPVKGKKYISKLTDVNVTLDGGEAKFKKSFYSNGEYHSVKMQTPDERFISAGEHTFVLSYVYDMSDDKVKGFDDFTFDVLGYAMAFTAEVEAEITFPDEIDPSAVTFRTNQMAGWEADAQKGESALIEGNKITVVARPLTDDKGYTVQVLFSDGYFSVSRTFYWYYLVFAALILTAVVFQLIIIVKHAPREPLETVEFYPPDGVPIMRYSAIWHKEPREKDATALILKWANAGLISIEQDGKSELILRADVEKEDAEYFDNAEELDYYKALMHNDICPDGTFHTRIFKKTYELKYSGKRELSLALTKLVSSGERKDPLVPHSTLAEALMPIFGFVPTFVLAIYGCILAGTAMPLFLLVFMAAGTFTGKIFRESLFTFFSLIYALFPLTFYGFIYAAFSVGLFVPLYDYLYLTYLAPAWWFFSVMIAPFFLGRRTDEANALYGKMLGFKRFLLTAELPRIQLLFDENPEYFLEILPWCYIMGISDKVIKRFKPLDVKVPDYVQNRLSIASISSSLARSGSSGSSHGGGGGGHGGSSGGGGGGGGSRGC